MNERSERALASRPLVGRHRQTFTVALLVLVFAGLVAGLLQVPLVALGPGPTFNTLGEDHGKPVVTIVGLPTYPTSGHLNLTTVRVTDGLTALTALRFWADPTWRVIPREVIYPSGKTDKQVEQENTKQFSESEMSAETAALGYLRQPLKVIVEQVGPNAPAAGVLRAGDQLLSVNGVPVDSPTEVSQLLTRTKPGDQVTLGYRRGDAPPTQGMVTVGVRPPGIESGAPDGPQGFLGIVPGAALVDPNQIKIQLNDIGGPSAGLMFTLALIDKLTPGELTGGRFIAGTGTISSNGVVGKIDGIAQKMIGARGQGATVFIVPAANCEQAVDADHAGLQLVKVATVGDAVNGLTALNEGRTPPSC